MTKKMSLRELAEGVPSEQVDNVLNVVLATDDKALDCGHRKWTPQSSAAMNNGLTRLGLEYARKHPEATVEEIRTALQQSLFLSSSAGTFFSTNPREILG